MSLQFSYQTLPLLLATSAVVYSRPYVPIRIIGKTGSRNFSHALLDSGADDTIFPSAMAAILFGGKPTHASTRPSTAIRWRGQIHEVDFFDVDLELNDGTSSCRWSTTAGFSSAPIPTPLLGQRGLFEYFSVTFMASELRLLLEPNFH